MRWRGDLQLNAEAGRNDAVLRNCGRLWTMPQPHLSSRMSVLGKAKMNSPKPMAYRESTISF